MNKISRYIFFRFLNTLLVVIICITFLFLVIDYVEKSTKWSTRETKEVLTYYIHFIPYIFYLILPISIVIASIFSFGKMAVHLEITAIRSAGISTFKILFPTLFFGVILTLGLFYFSNKILPESNHKRFSILQPKTIENKRGNPNIKYHLLYIVPNASYYFDHYFGKLKEGSLVSLFFKDSTNNLKERYDAQKIKWQDSIWILKNGTKKTFSGDSIHTTSFKELPITKMKAYPEDIITTRIFPEEMTRTQLKQKINILERTGEKSNRSKTQLHLKISSTFASIIMLVLGIALSINTYRSGLSKKFALAVMYFFLYFTTLRMFVAIGESGGITPILATWIANIIFGTISFLFLIRVFKS